MRTDPLIFKGDGLKMLESECCSAGVLLTMSPDFLGDDVKAIRIGTCYYQCKKCGKACNIKQEKREE